MPNAMKISLTLSRLKSLFSSNAAGRAPVSNPIHVKTSFIPEIESLRGLAAFAVLVEHSYLYFDRPALGIFKSQADFPSIVHWLIHVAFNGRSAVVLFFVISGYVLARQLQSTPCVTVAGLGAFIIRRIFRIVPAMWVAALLAFCAALFLQRASGVGVPLLVKTLFFQDFTLNTPLWSLIVEMACSLLFPVLYLFNLHVKKIFGVLILLPLTALIFIQGVEPTHFIRYIVFFQFGVLVGVHGSTVVNSFGRSCRPLVFCVACLVYGVAPQLWPFNDKYFNYFDDRYYLLLEGPASFFILSYVIYGQNNFLRLVLTSSVARFFGKISFSLYLLHYIFSSHLWPIYASSQDLTFLWPYRTLFQTIFFLIIACLSIPLATIVYRYVEVPFNHLGQRIARRITGAPDGKPRRFRPCVQTNLEELFVTFDVEALGVGVSDFGRLEVAQGCGVVHAEQTITQAGVRRIILTVPLSKVIEDMEFRFVTSGAGTVQVKGVEIGSKPTAFNAVLVVT